MSYEVIKFVKRVGNVIPLIPKDVQSELAFLGLEKDYIHRVELKNDKYVVSMVLVAPPAPCEHITVNFKIGDIDGNSN